MKLQKSKKASNIYLKYSGLAFQMMGVIALAVWGGLSLDKYLDIKFPAFTLAFILFAIIGSIVLLIKSVPKY